MPRLNPPATPAAPPDPGGMLKKDAVAARLAISTRKLDKMIAAGEFPAGTYALGRCPRWTTATVNGWINGLCPKG